MEITNSEELLAEFDAGSSTRIFSGVYKKVISALCVAVSAYILLLTLILTDSTVHTRRTSFLALVVFLGFLLHPAYKKQRKRVNYIPWYDILLSLTGCGCFLFYTFNQRKIITLNSTNLPVVYIVIAMLAILIVSELCRRTVGIPIIVIAAAFTAYLFYYYAKNPRLTLGRVLSQTVYNLFYNINDGVLGTPINICIAFIALFIIMGSLLEKTGIAAFFIDLANSVAGGSVGGPAKVAVISSGLEGMISGSSVANTVGSGSVTIPVMKKAGYRPEFAAAVEAAASTGGQIMPPIMGAAAFLMAEMSGISYSAIAISAILPAILYFSGIFIMVHFEARKNGLEGLPRDALPNFFKLVFKKGYLLTPVVVLVVCMNYLSAGLAAAVAIAAAMMISLLPEELSNVFGSAKSAFTALLRPAVPLAVFLLILLIFGTKQLSAAVFAAMVICIVIGFICKNSVSMPPKDFAGGLENAAKNTLTVAVACAMAGIIAATVTATSLASSITPFIRSLAGISPVFALFATMICCIILGMGVPTTANYVIMGSTIAPILISQLGVSTLSAHMFVFYFGIVADITPPVALAAYAGSAIAHSNPMKTGIIATKLAIAAFVIPYIFALDPASTLLIGYTSAPFIKIVIAVITAMFGMFALSCGLEGWAFGKLSPVTRILFCAAGLLLVFPEIVTDIIGVSITVLLLILSKIKYKNPLKAKA